MNSLSTTLSRWRPVPGSAEHIQTNSRVISIARAGFDKVKTVGRENAPFEIRYRNGKGPSTVRADAVIDASGTWGMPNPAGVNGLDAIGETEHAQRIAYGMPDVFGAERARYAGKIVAVLGAGHSAVGTILDLARLKQAEPQTQIVWLLRGDNPEKSFGGGANDKLAARGELGKVFAELVQGGGVRVEAGFRLTHIGANGEKLRLGSGSACCGRHVDVDELIVATGFRPDLSFLRELRISLDPALECPPTLAPLIDPNLHSCGTVRPHGARELAQPEPGFYFAGMKSYGRAPTFLMMTGYEQVRSIIADIAGDKEAAERVELVLPETGVCSRPLTVSSEGEGAAADLRQLTLMPVACRMPTRRRPEPRGAVAPDGDRCLFDFASPYGLSQKHWNAEDVSVRSKPHKQMSDAPNDAPLLKYPERREALR